VITPSLGPLRYPFQNDVRPVWLGRVVANHEPCLPTSDDNSLDMCAHEILLKRESNLTE
jgi:hypothetical protein